MNTPHKILVADDSLTIRKLVESVLHQDGYEVIIAENGAECLQKASAHKPSLILLDYILPDMQGTEVCRSLINTSDTWEIPVLMMSSNGNAIRQLYQDLNNVADYLTKPFAPNVLKAVVSSLLKRPSAPREGESVTPVPQPSPAPAVPQDFMDKVTRLLHLMEEKQSPAKPAPEAMPAPVPVASTAKPKVRRKRKSVSAVPVSDSLTRKFRTAFKKHLRPQLRHVPEWEALRNGIDPEEYFLTKLLSKETTASIAGDILRATGIPAQTAGAFRCPVSITPLLTLLDYLHAIKATGELRLEIEDEAVMAFISAGAVQLITSNNPRNYCAGAPCNFQAASHDAIGDAVRAQEELGIPFFVSLYEAGELPPENRVEDLVRLQGEKCLARMYKAPGVIASFYPQAKLPAIVSSIGAEMKPNQLALICHRTVDDWFVLEKHFTNMDAVWIPAPGTNAIPDSVELDSVEKCIWHSLMSGHTVNELAEIARLKPSEVCCVLYRFIKLGFVCEKPTVASQPHTPTPPASLPAPQPEGFQSSLPAESPTEPVKTCASESSQPLSSALIAPESAPHSEASDCLAPTEPQTEPAKIETIELTQPSLDAAVVAETALVPAPHSEAPECPVSTEPQTEAVGVDVAALPPLPSSDSASFETRPELTPEEDARISEISAEPLPASDPVLTGAEGGTPDQSGAIVPPTVSVQ